jgi:hypothetical protein
VPGSLRLCHLTDIRVTYFTVLTQNRPKEGRRGRYKIDENGDIK